MPEAQNVSTNGSGGGSMLKIKIVEQIEYYFGDFNLVKDKYLKQEILKDNGWVPISTLLRFNRLSALTKDTDVVLSAFEENPTESIEVDPVRKCVRRNPDRPIPELDEAWKSVVAQRTVYVKGFPTETTTLDDILTFMQTFGKVDNVYKRNYHDKALKAWKFKGSVYVAFPSVEEAEKFVSIKSVKFSGNELIRKMQLDYMEEKKNERLEYKLKTKQMKDELLKEQHEEMKKEMKKLPTGALIYLTGLTTDINRNTLKDTVKKLGWDVAFVDHNLGETTAYIRLQEQDSAKKVLEKLDNNSFKIEDTTVTAEIVQGEKEEELLKKMEDDKSTKVLQNVMKTRKSKKFKGTNKKPVAQDNSNNSSSSSSSSSNSSNNTSEKKSENGEETSAKETNNKDDEMEISNNCASNEDTCSSKRKCEEDLGESPKKPKS